MQNRFTAIDLFCGIGGLSYGLHQAGISVLAGIDLDESCEFSFEKNVGCEFVPEDISEIRGEDLIEKYWSDKNDVKILVGCAPCQPFSSHSHKNKERGKGKKWFLLNEFIRIIKETSPDIISMENVPNLKNKEIFNDFIRSLKEEKYYVSYSVVYCPDYGIPQKRKRLVLTASKYGKLRLISPSHAPENYISTKDAIGNLPAVKAGGVCESDPLHRTTNLSEINLKRIQASRPNGTWMDWDESLRLACHKKESGNTYRSVYGRMSWSEPSPTITTQFYNYGTGRFGHPEQDRSITIREAAILQTFPSDYIFYKEEKDISMSKLGTHIGNAVPVKLGYVIGKSIIEHIEDNVQ